MNNIYLKL